MCLSEAKSLTVCAHFADDIFKRDVVSISASWTAYFLLVVRVTPVLLTQSSDNVCIVMAILALVTLNSSVSAVSGNGSFVSLPYRLMFEPEGGFPCHFHKCHASNTILRTFLEVCSCLYFHDIDPTVHLWSLHCYLRLQS